MMQTTDKATIPEDIDIAPRLIDYRYKTTSPVDVHISNVTTRTIVIPPRGILCKIQSVTIEPYIEIVISLYLPVNTHEFNHSDARVLFSMLFTLHPCLITQGLNDHIYARIHKLDTDKLNIIIYDMTSLSFFF